MPALFSRRWRHQANFFVITDCFDLHASLVTEIANSDLYKNISLAPVVTTDITKRFMSSEEQKTTPTQKGGLIAGGSVVSGLAAFIGASCCVLPLVLVNLGVSSALVGKLAFFARAQQYFMGAAVILLVSAIVTSFWNGKRPSKRVGIAFFLATIFVMAGYIMPSYEGQLLRWISQ